MSGGFVVLYFNYESFYHCTLLVFYLKISVAVSGIDPGVHGVSLIFDIAVSYLLCTL